MHNLIYSAFHFLVASILYIASGYVLRQMEFVGLEALLSLVITHILFGIIGYFIFSGSLRRRSLLIFFVVIFVGVIFEITRPAPGHHMVQLFVTIPLGFIAAAASPLGRHMEYFLTRNNASSE